MQNANVLAEHTRILPRQRRNVVSRRADRRRALWMSLSMYKTNPVTLCSDERGANTKVLCFVVYLSKKNKYKQCHVRMWWPDLTRVIDCITYLNCILWFCDPAGTIRYNRVNKSLQYKRNQGVLSVSLNELSMEIVSHQRFSSLTSVAKLVAKLS